MTTLTGKTIGQLISLSAITDNTLFPVEFSGKTYHIPYSAFTNAVTGVTFDGQTNILTISSENSNDVSTLINRYNRWHIPSGYTYTVENGYQSFIFGDLVVEGTIDLQDTGELVVLNGNLDLSGGTIIGSGTTTVISLPEYDTFLTGGTFDPITKQITLTGNFDFLPVNVDLSSVSTEDFYTTGGTYNSLTENIDFSGNSSATTFSVDVSQLLDDTNTYTTGATLNGNIVEFNRNDLSNAYSVDLTPLIFTGNTSGDCITDLFVSNLNSCSPLHIQPINNGDVYILEGGGNVGIGTSTPITTLDVNGDVNVSNSLSATTFYGDGSNLTGIFDIYTTGGTYSNNTLRLDRNDGNQVTVTGFTDNYTTGATLNGNIVEFNRNDLSNAYSVDLSNLNLPINYSNVVFVDVINGNNFTAIINNFNRPCATISQGINIAITLPGLSSDNRALVYIRRGNYVNPVLFLQNNVDVYCEPGVVFTNIVQIRDNGVAVNSNIYGKLKINSGGSTIPFNINGASFIYFEFDSIVSNACAIEVNIASSGNNIRIKGNSIYSNTFGQGFGITIRSAANVTLNISEKIESIHQTLRFRFYTGKTTINCPNIFLVSGNLYGGNWKQIVYLDSSLSTGEVVINGNLVCTDTVNYGGIGSIVRFWDSTNITFKLNGDIVAGVIPGIVLSSGAGKMVLNGNISGDQTCISTDGLNKLVINNGSVVRKTTTFASPFSVGGSSEVYVNNTYYYSDFFGNMINIESNNAKLYLNNFISEGFIDITGTTGTFINTGVASPTLGLNNVSTNRNYNNSLNTGYLINLTSDSNIKVPNFF